MIYVSRSGLARKSACTWISFVWEKVAIQSFQTKSPDLLEGMVAILFSLGQGSKVSVWAS